VVERLLGAHEGVTPSALAGAVSLPRAAAERILKRLAVRGLVREVEGIWVPTPVLLQGMPLLRCD
jgi:DNA-binding IclR family transcriptional regulator